MENGVRKPISRTTGLPVKNNQRKAQKILEDRKREYDEMGLAGMLSFEERERRASMPLVEYMRYVVDRKRNIQPTTRSGYLQLINGRISSFFTPKHTTISSLTPAMIEDFIESMAEDGLANTTQNDYLRVLNNCLRYALKKEHITKNPMDKVDRPRKGKSKAQFYSKDEAEQLLECAKGEVIYIPVMLALIYGLRRSEVCGLLWSSIDWENNRIHIDHKAYRDTSKQDSPLVISDVMKTESSRRTLPMIPFVREELEKHREQQEYYRKMFRSGYNNKWLDCVCVTQVGDIIMPGKLSTHFSALLKKNDLRHIRFHDLRHSCASLLVANGIPIKMVQIYLRHSNYSTTADVYAHLTPEALDSTAACMENLLGPKQKSKVSKSCSF